MTVVPVAKRKRDWFVVIRALMRRGVSMGDIASACGRDKSTVKGWHDGGEPKESDARIVLALLAKHAPEEYVQQQREFDIRVAVDALTQSGEQTALPFVELK